MNTITTIHWLCFWQQVFLCMILSDTIRQNFSILRRLVGEILHFEFGAYLSRSGNLFEDRAPVDFIYGCPNFTWVARTLDKWQGTRIAVPTTKVGVTFPIVNIIFFILQIMIALAAIIGNALVILLFYKFSFMRTVTNVYVISLAMADLLVGLVGIPCAIAVSVGLPKNFQVTITNG